jgi:hypothetical protein
MAEQQEKPETGELAADTRSSNIATQILAEYRAVLASETDAAARHTDALAHAIACGALLISQKDICKRGTWMKWCQTHCAEMSQRTIDEYMRIARDKDLLPGPDSQRCCQSIRDALKIIKKANPRPRRSPPGARNKPNGSPDLADLIKDHAPDEVALVLKTTWNPEKQRQLITLLSN